MTEGRWTAAERQHQARVMAQLFGSTAVLALLLLALDLDLDLGETLARNAFVIAVVAAGLGLLVFFLGDRVGQLGALALTASGTVLVGAAQLSSTSPQTATAIGLVYVVIAMHSGRFFSFGGIVVQLTWSAVVQLLVVTFHQYETLALTPVALSVGTQVITATTVRGLATRLRFTAETDPLTGLANRRTLDRQVTAALSRSRRDPGSPTCLAVMDFNDFKILNDTYGHLEGDRALVGAANAWTRILRPTDTLARLGGDEFVVVMPDTTAEQAERIIRRLLSACPPQVSCSAGIAAWNGTENGEGLLARADAALYKAKTDGPVHVAASEDLPAGRVDG